MAQVPTNVLYHLRDINKELVQNWSEMFDAYPDDVQISEGDIFKGAPAVDALVAPGNSFGIVEGAIGSHCCKHFGTQLKSRLQKVIQKTYDGELLVGQAVIIPAYEPPGRDETKDWSQFNHGVAIKHFIYSPTMRVPLNVSQTPNAYLSFRAVILAVREYNRRYYEAPIKSVLVPGLGTAAGRMPSLRCAWQMMQAYETFVQDKHPSRLMPELLGDMSNDHEKMCQQ